MVYISNPAGPAVPSSRLLLTIHCPGIELAVAHDILAMHATRSTRSSVLGKRAYQHQEASTASIAPCDEQLRTPDTTPNAKRVRTSLEVPDSDANKENVPPLSPEVAMDIPSPASVRTLRRTTTEFVTPSRPRRGEFQSLRGTWNSHLSL